MFKYNSLRSLALLVSFAGLAFNQTSTYAVDGNWNANASDNWSVASRWTSDPNIPGGAGSTVGLTFNISGSNRTVTIDTTSRIVGTLSIGDPDSTNQYFLAASGGGTLIMDNSGSGASIVRTGTQNITINAPITLNEATDVNTGGATNGVILGGSISGVGITLTKSGSGNLTIANNNTHSANISSSVGNLTISSAGTSTFDGDVTLSGGQLAFSIAGIGMAGSGLLTLNGVTYGVPNSGADTVVSMDQRWDGNVSLTNVSFAGYKTVFSGDITLGASMTLANKATIEISGDIGETGGSRKITSTNNTGTNTLILSGDNTFTGGVQLNSGRLHINSATALGTGTLTMNVNGGIIDNSSGSAITLINNNVQEWNQNFTFTGSNDLNLGTGAVTMSAGRNVTVNGGKLTVGGNISGEFSFNKLGAGTLTLTGTGSTFGTNNVATVQISAGTLEVAKLSNKGVASSIGDANADYSLRIGNGATLRYIGTGDSTNYRLQYQGGGTTTIESSGSGALNFTSTQNLGSFSGGTAQTIILAGTNADDNTFSPQLANNGIGVMSLTKEGAGKWILANTNNTYTGATAVNDGTLLVNGSTAVTSAFTVASLGILGGTGSIGGTVAVDGTLSPGGSIESLASGALTMNNGSTFMFEAVDNTSTGADLMVVNGALSLTGVDLDLTGADLDANAWVAGDKLTLISYTGSAITSGFVGFANNSLHTFGLNEWRFLYDDSTPGSNFISEATGSQFVTMELITVVPEPSSLAMLAFGLISLWLFRRK